MILGGRRPALAPDPDLIRSLAKLLDETGLTEIECAAGDQRIRVSRQAIAAAPLPAPLPVVSETSTQPEPAPSANGAYHPGANGHDHPGTLKAPLVGIAYLAAEPGAPPYVRVGDTVTEGQTLLIIEAMKVMNQIRAPRAGRVSQIYVGDAEPVEYDTALMLIE
ncbi:MAG TPA: acetyl-CoA carboxylase biotin carboxyl carrier protein subunit [Stellaceae bacterium]|nr:acetyl-CoA carboxylase biotin carboxyl carrier protein subunit [Stellaceae bacterium]